jgi:hypothetical protein
MGYLWQSADQRLCSRLRLHGGAALALLQLSADTVQCVSPTHITQSCLRGRPEANRARLCEGFFDVNAVETIFRVLRGTHSPLCQSRCHRHWPRMPSRQRECPDLMQKKTQHHCRGLGWAQKLSGGLFSNFHLVIFLAAWKLLQLAMNSLRSHSLERLARICS